MEINKKHYFMSIVFIGEYSPLMFQPHWMLKNNVIDQAEYDSIELKNKEKCLISDAIAFYETDGFSFRIEKNRFQIISKKKPFALAIDTLSKLAEVFPSFPISAFGLNYYFHVSIDDKNKMELIGKTLAPRDYWGELFEKNFDDDTKKSGLTSISFKKFEENHILNVTMETSPKLKSGLFFNYNFHYNKNEECYDFEDVLSIIQSDYQNHENKAHVITQQLINNVLSEEEHD